MEKRDGIPERSVVELIIEVTAQIAEGYEPMGNQLSEEQVSSLRVCMLYVHEWAEGMLRDLEVTQDYETQAARNIKGIRCTKMCSGEGATEPNKVILNQVQKLRELEAEGTSGTDE